MHDQNYIRDIAEKIGAHFDQSQLPDNGLDELLDAYALLALAKGQAVTDEDVHNAWAAWATKFEPDNVALVPFKELSLETQQEDAQFTEAIRNVAEAIG
jgi:hypothetical protein